MLHNFKVLMSFSGYQLLLRDCSYNKPSYFPHNNHYFGHPNPNSYLSNLYMYIVIGIISANCPEEFNLVIGDVLSSMTIIKVLVSV